MLMIKVMIIRSPELPHNLCAAVCKELGLQMLYIDRDFDKSDVPSITGTLKQAEEERMDAIISSYYTYNVFVPYESVIPFIPLNFSHWDTLYIVHSLKKNVVFTHFPQPHKVALITMQPLLVDLTVLSEIFDLELHNVIREKEQLPDSFFLQLKEAGYEIAACGPRYRDQVLAAGMYHAYDPTIYSHTGLLEEFQRIMALINTGANISRRHREMAQMMNYSFEAIWMTDHTGAVTSYNDLAAGLFRKSNTGARGETFRGCSVYDLLPEKIHHILDDVLENGSNYYSYLLLHTYADGIFNITPISEGKSVTAVIFHFTSLPHLEQIEEQVKTEAYVKGHKAKYTFQDLIGTSAPMKQAVKLADRFAKYDSNVLLLGKSGTGKEMFAQSIHNASLRSRQAFVALNCGAMPPNLLESELFGYVDGAFTGASRKGKKGLFEIADQGTIFLDEISEMDMEGQLRLLRVLEEHEIMRIGSDRVVPVNVRVIAACNKNLGQLVEEGRFRDDLFYRLNVLTIQLPSLHERTEDILPLSTHFLQYYSRKYNKPVHLNPLSQAALTAYHWPGNIRQLRNFCERLVIVADTNTPTTAFVEEQLLLSYPDSRAALSDMPTTSDNTALAQRSEPAFSAGSIENFSGKNTCRQILAALAQSHGNRGQAAALLGISTSTLWRKMKKYHITSSYEQQEAP